MTYGTLLKGYRLDAHVRSDVMAMRLDMPHGTYRDMEDRGVGAYDAPPMPEIDQVATVLRLLTAERQDLLDAAGWELDAFQCEGIHA